ncbi:MAG TPA: nucleoside triphosphate pyrophosphohydrolase [Steroidobacteraceae bacterium]|nr:nucleoside triphosphate pyrophosphohydrolase [Steroidobacteraceae bacterium]
MSSRTPIDELLAIMERLRAPDGCPWDREQTFASIAPYTLEEAYEVADAIEREHLEELREELGDLLFQVVFHAQMAREAGHFDFNDVARSIGEKLKRRHPHVFGSTGPLSVEQQSVAWEESKARERAARAAGGAPSALDGVPQTLPALMRAHKLSQRAARVGFDWQQASQTADKVAEELAEVREAAGAAAVREAAGAGVREASGTSAPAAQPVASMLGHAQIFEEMGDLLFAAANLARKLEVDAESALRAANAKFERRFRAMERLARSRGLDFAQLPLDVQEELWQEVKRGE